MKSLLKYASIFSLATLTMILTGCNRQPNFDVTLENGDDLAIETDSFSLTNQEAFELVASGYLGWINPGIVTILDWVDSIILADVEIDEALLIEEREEMEETHSADELQEMLLIEGFDSLDHLFESVRLGRLREQAILDSIIIDEADILAEYERVFADEDSDEDAPDDEMRELILDALRDEYLNTVGYGPGVIATLRAEAGFTIHSNYFATHYENFLESWMIEEIEVEIGNESAVVASIDGHYLTVDEFFNETMSQFALNQSGELFNHLNLNLLQGIYNVDHSVIRDDVNEAKLNMLQWFYQQMEIQGLNTEQEIFNHFHLVHLQNLVFDEVFSEVSDERLLELYDQHIENLMLIDERNNTPTRGARHILIRENDEMTDEEARELAEDLLAQLKAADPGDVTILFIELAMEYSADAAGIGGDLGHFGPGDMVIEFEEAAFALEVGEFTTELVETQFGYHIIYVYDIQDLAYMPPVEPLDIPTFEEIESQLAAFELQRLRNNDLYITHLMFNVRADQNIRFSNEQLQSRYESLREQTRTSVED